MTLRPLMLSLTLAGLLSASYAQAEMSPKQQYSADNQRASERYIDDKKLCAEEKSSKVRMQCTRDAKSEYNAALAEAKQRRDQPQHARCDGCAKVLAVHMNQKAGEGGALGLIGGGVAGALLGNQVGSGGGRKLATIAGAAGGAYAGKKVEERARSSEVWSVDVQYENGEKARFDFAQDPGLKAGDQVRNDGNSIVRR